jgi:hypothetical protein
MSPEQLGDGLGDGIVESSLEEPVDDQLLEEMIMHLERDQLVAETVRPVHPAELGSRAVIALWALRVFVVLVSLMVIYAFVHRLG